MTELGVKELTSENWLTSDWAVSRVNPDDWINAVCAPSLSASVPVNIRTLFEGARGAVCYGYYFYPLFMLGVERLFATAEAAVRDRAKQIRGTWPRNTSFQNYIDFLADHGVISSEAKQDWHSTRGLRNQAVHPDQQQLAPPGPTLDTLILVADAINRLFDPIADVPETGTV